MEGIDWLKVAKWVLIVLIAGFIGQFGKTFAKHLMEKLALRRRRRSAGPPPMERTEQGQAVPPHAETAATLPEPREITGAERSKEEAKRKKKEAKALVKQKKKEAKQLQKGEE